MGTTSYDYLRLFQSLLPKGKAWNCVEGSVLTEFLYALAEELARVAKRSEDLIIESDVRNASELLEDFEKDLGLPDECSTSDPSVQERRLLAHAKLTSWGRQNPAYFIELAKLFGWDITITENGAATFSFTVNVFYNGTNLVWFICGASECGDLISYLLGLENLICLINKYKPAHTTCDFIYYGPPFDQSFNNAFDSLISDGDAYLEGAFWHEFSSAFDCNNGGEFYSDSFSIDFSKPA